MEIAIAHRFRTDHEKRGKMRSANRWTGRIRSSSSTGMFIEGADGTKLVNPRFSGKENLMDLHGNAVIRNQNAVVMKEGGAWIDLW